jgi:hypothetical protein
MLTSLLENKVEFLTIGGYAVILHGYIRTTGDLDIWINPSPENKLRLLEVLSKLQFDPAGIEIVRNMDFTNVVVFHIGVEPERIDFLTQIAGVDFAKAQDRQEYFSYQNYRIPYLHIDDLIVNKLRSGRLQDVADVDALQKIAIRKKG